MVKTPWFQMKQHTEDILACQLSKNYPYYMSEMAYATLENGTSTYTFLGKCDFPDFIFSPTFLISDKYREIMGYLQPNLEFKIIQFMNDKRSEKLPSPVYWVPYLHETNALDSESDIKLGKAYSVVLKEEALIGQRILHIHLPADELWLFSLEAAECILRRGPIGIVFEKVRVKGNEI